MPYRRHAGAYPEWAYRHIDRRILVETYWGGPHGLPGSLCLLCNDGELTAMFTFHPDAEVQTHVYQFHLASESARVLAWSGLDAAQWQLLVDSSRSLSAGIDMVRVDWMVGDRAGRFNELTCYPAAGRGDYSGHDRLSATEFEAAISSPWQLP